MTAQLTRRSFVAGGMAMAAACGVPASAQDKRFAGRQVVFATFTSTRDMFLQEIGTWLQRTTGGELSVLPLPESVAYARMQAELADPQIDMFVSISENELDAKTRGISQKITYMDNARKIAPERSVICSMTCSCRRWTGRAPWRLCGRRPRNGGRWPSWAT